MDIIKIIADTAITGSGGTPQDNACKYIGGCTDENQFSGKLQAILNWIFSIIGIVAVIMIILGGFTMMTSSGDLVIQVRLRKAKTLFFMVLLVL